MFTSSWTESRWGCIARGTLALVLDGTGTVLIVAGCVAEYCGDRLQDLATRVAPPPHSGRGRQAGRVVSA